MSADAESPPPLPPLPPFTAPYPPELPPPPQPAMPPSPSLPPGSNSSDSNGTISNSTFLSNSSGFNISVSTEGRRLSEAPLSCGVINTTTVIEYTVVTTIVRTSSGGTAEALTSSELTQALTRIDVRNSLNQTLVPCEPEVNVEREVIVMPSPLPPPMPPEQPPTTIPCGAACGSMAGAELSAGIAAAKPTIQTAVVATIGVAVIGSAIGSSIGVAGSTAGGAGTAAIMGLLGAQRFSMMGHLADRVNAPPSGRRRLSEDDEDDGSVDTRDLLLGRLGLFNRAPAPEEIEEEELPCNATYVTFVDANGTEYNATNCTHLANVTDSGDATASNATAEEEEGEEEFDLAQFVDDFQNIDKFSLEENDSIVIWTLADAACSFVLLMGAMVILHISFLCLWATSLNRQYYKEVQETLRQVKAVGRNARGSLVAAIDATTVATAAVVTKADQALDTALATATKVADSLAESSVTREAFGEAKHQFTRVKRVVVSSADQAVETARAAAAVVADAADNAADQVREAGFVTQRIGIVARDKVTAVTRALDISPAVAPDTPRSRDAATLLQARVRRQAAKAEVSARRLAEAQSIKENAAASRLQATARRRAAQQQVLEYKCATRLQARWISMIVARRVRAMNLEGSHPGRIVPTWESRPGSAHPRSLPPSPPSSPPPRSVRIAPEEGESENRPEAKSRRKSRRLSLMPSFAHSSDGDESDESKGRRKSRRLSLMPSFAHSSERRRSRRISIRSADRVKRIMKIRVRQVQQTKRIEKAKNFRALPSLLVWPNLEMTLLMTLAAGVMEAASEMLVAPFWREDSECDESDPLNATNATNVSTSLILIGATNATNATTTDDACEGAPSSLSNWWTVLSISMSLLIILWLGFEARLLIDFHKRYSKKCWRSNRATEEQAARREERARRKSQKRLVERVRSVRLGDASASDLGQLGALAEGSRSSLRQENVQPLPEGALAEGIRSSPPYTPPACKNPALARALSRPRWERHEGPPPLVSSLSGGFLKHLGNVESLPEPSLPEPSLRSIRREDSNVSLSGFAEDVAGKVGDLAEDMAEAGRAMAEDVADDLAEHMEEAKKQIKRIGLVRQAHRRSGSYECPEDDKEEPYRTEDALDFARHWCSCCSASGHLLPKRAGLSYDMLSPFLEAGNPSIRGTAFTFVQLILQISVAIVIGGFKIPAASAGGSWAVTQVVLLGFVQLAACCWACCGDPSDKLLGSMMAFGSLFEFMASCLLLAAHMNIADAERARSLGQTATTFYQVSVYAPLSLTLNDILLVPLLLAINRTRRRGREEKWSRCRMVLEIALAIVRFPFEVLRESLGVLLPWLPWNELQKLFAFCLGSHDKKEEVPEDDAVDGEASKITRQNSKAGMARLRVAASTTGIVPRHRPQE